MAPLATLSMTFPTPSDRLIYSLCPHYYLYRPDQADFLKVRVRHSLFLSSERGKTSLSVLDRPEDVMFFWGFFKTPSSHSDAVRVPGAPKHMSQAISADQLTLINH